MSRKTIASIAIYFADLEDPRVDRTQYHPLINVVVIGLCAVICGAQHFTEMQEFGNEKKDWLSKFLDLSMGIPSHDTFNKVFARLKPEQFEKCLLDWITTLHELSDGQILAIDGKTLRGSYDRADARAAIHMVSVLATRNHMSLGSMVVDEKSNEITAIPRLLELIDVSASLVTIDAMGCQKEIAQKILQEKGDYVLAVKDNQPKLHDAVREFFVENMENDFANTPCRRHTTREEDHGRKEERSYYLAAVPDEFGLQKQWPGLKALGMAITMSQRDGHESAEVRYYILSDYASGRRFADHEIRGDCPDLRKGRLEFRQPDRRAADRGRGRLSHLRPPWQRRRGQAEEEAA